ncbi:ion channel [Devosia rhodophyticola]|uniref:Ion channel n=1 Tax=Devosia rhodophyticola TaxID=3026423 RepID=A0ABY7YV67_9HYPH|nr:potassium channel family protein [Devosia rhodophyticola]WDR05204.1 ion channel [Devosia rhodophyticola]
MSVAAGSPRAEVAKTGGLLGAMVLHNLIYPLSTSGGVGPLIFYAVYASIFVLGTWLLTQDKRLRGLAVVTGATAFAAGIVNSYAASRGAALGVSLTSIAYHGVMIAVLVRYTFTARTVLTEVILAATLLYLVLGSLFAAVFGLLLWFEPGAFADSSGAQVQWQQLLYFSYATLTTLGYGDIVPKSFYAQAFAAFEAIVGTLYTVVLLSRLVGLHASARS